MELLARLKKPNCDSKDAFTIKSMFKGVNERIKNEYVMGDSETRMIIDEALLKYVKELELVLHDKNVRGHLDQEVRLPEINKELTTGQLLEHLKKQAKACCNLSNAIFRGPPANPQENAVIAKALQILNHI